MKRIASILVLAIVGIVSLAALYPEGTTQLALYVERSRSGLSYNSVVVGDEIWHYLEGGPAEAEVLLLLHGFGADKDNWTRFSRSLTDDYRVIAPDLPGFGESARQQGQDYSLLPQRARLNSFAEKLGLGRFHITGNSMGGQLAALYSHEYPEQTLSLGLFNNAGIVAPNESDFAVELKSGRNPLIVDKAEDFDKLIDFVSFKKPFVPWPMKGVLAQMAADNAEFNRYIFAQIVNDREADLEPILADIACPVLILWGEYDRGLDVSSIDVMRPLLPQAQIVVMKNTGHIPMLERPAETATHYLRFLGSL